MSNKAAAKADVLQGTLDLMVLRTLDVLGPSHGYAIAGRLAQVSDGALRLNMGTLYPALLRMESYGWLTWRWEEIDPSREGRPRRRLYKITGAGELAAHQIASEADRRKRLRDRRTPGVRPLPAGSAT